MSISVNSAGPRVPCWYPITLTTHDRSAICKFLQRYEFHTVWRLPSLAINLESPFRQVPPRQYIGIIVIYFAKFAAGL